MKRLYFDYNATAPITSDLPARLQEWIGVDPKNPSSAHAEGRQALSLLESSRKTVLRLLGAAKGDRTVFTSGGTEANNAVLVSAFLNRKGSNRILLTGIEHNCVMQTALYLSTLGAELVWIQVNRQGEIDLDEYQRQLDGGACLVACMLANNETGFVLPVKTMAKLARMRGIPFLTDAVCAAGKIPIDFQDLGVDFLTISSHKFGALKGSGAILCRKNVSMTPLLHGGPQENGKRAGTQNLIGIMSTAHALEFSVNQLDHEIIRQQKMRDAVKQGILKLYPTAVVTEAEMTLPQTLNVSFTGLDGTLLLTALDLEGVAVSHGSACASGSLEISHVLRHIGAPEADGKAAVRFSFGRQTEEQDVQDLLDRLSKVLKRMSIVS
jgi:cysteine desulfurase